MNDHLLSLMTFIPALTALVVLLVPGNGKDSDASRWIALAGSLAALAVSIVIFMRFVPLPATATTLGRGSEAMQMVERMPWIPTLGVGYVMGIDGISLFLVLLTTVLTPIVIASSWTGVDKRVREYHVFMLLLETGMLGTFLALDAVLFYVFWEATLVPMYFLVGIWGGERRIYAAVKFFIYTAVGSLLMLLAILYVYLQHRAQLGAPSALIFDLMKVNLPLGAELWLFAAFGLAFAIKVPLFPFHTWLPDAHVEAPTGGSVILAGVMLKMGTYGFIRWAMPLFPEAAFAFVPVILALGGIGVIYGALVALVQPDMKRLVAYSSVSHLGYVMLGLFALESVPTRSVSQVSGAVLQMVNHGLSTGALFLLVGILYERRHTREIVQYGGIAKRMPMFAAILLFVTLSSIGLPGLNGFVGEFLILLGTYKVNAIAGVAGAAGVVLGAVYMLWLYQRVVLGPLDRAENEALTDTSKREALYLLPVLAGILVIGVFPQPFLSRIEPAVQVTLEAIERGIGPEVGVAAIPAEVAR